MAELRIPTRVSPEAVANALASMGEAEACEFARDLFDCLRAFDEELAGVFLGEMMDAADMGDT